jgi:hypothetical protein
MRNIPGIDGALSAVQTNSAAPVLQLHDLQGDIVATAADNTTETKLLSTYNSTEFGVPNGGKAPPKYSWLGATGVSSELSSGVVTYGATSYVPQTGMALQSEEVMPPGLPEGSGGGSSYTLQEEPWNLQGAAREGAEAPGLEAGREIEAMEAACRANLAACPHEVEDPHWIWTFTTKQAETLAGAIIAADGYLTVTHISDIIKHVLGIDFVAQIEAELEKAIFGFSPDEVESWSWSLGESLGECAYLGLTLYGHPRNPHCWVYVETNKETWGINTPLGFIGATFEIPNFADDPQVAYCPRGTKYCYEV